VRGSGWATDWPKAVRGLHELAHAADRPLRKGTGLMFLPMQEKQEIERNAVTKCGQDRNGRRDCWEGGFTAAFRCAVLLRLATLASGEPRSEKHSPAAMGRREELAMREWQEIISREHIREHIRVARHEATLGESPPRNGQPFQGNGAYISPSLCSLARFRRRLRLG
jgi:hypothetical protein